MTASLGEKRVIAHFAAPPGEDDLLAVAQDAMGTLPEELEDIAATMELKCMEFPDPGLEADLELESSYELLALYEGSGAAKPGQVVRKSGVEPQLTLFRRPILDYWCELQEDFFLIVRQAIITELAQSLDYGDEAIDEMLNRAHPSLMNLAD